MFNDLLYPWNINNLILNKNKFLKISKNVIPNSKINIDVIGGYTNNDLFDWINIFCTNNKIKLKCNYSKWGKTHELMKQHSINLKTDIIFIFSNTYDFESNIDQITKKSFRILYQKIFNKWDEARVNSQYIFQTLIENPIIYNNSKQNLKIHQKINYFNSYILSQSSKYSNVTIIPTNLISNEIGLNNYYNLRNWHSYGQYKSYKSIIHLSSFISSLISNIYNISKKVLILDLDNTLWGGVFADDGINKISLGPDTNDGRAYYEFQKYLLNLKKNGVLLTICSKNSFNNIRSVFSHPYMLLKENDFVNIKTNWKNKHVNIKEICNDLNISTNDCVFIDDNKVEREIVRKYLPEISVPEIGDDASFYIDIIHNNNFFNLNKNITNEDKIRNQSYKQNIKRQKYESNFNDNDTDLFLKSLNTRIKIKKVDDFSFDRSVQLINKTNQFNLNTIRVTKNNFLNYKNSKNFFSFTCNVKDKFGEYGIVSIIYGEVSTNIIVTNWVLSCRIFNRKIENSIFIFLVNYFKKKGYPKIISKYTKSSKNDYVSNLHEKLNFIRIKKTQTSEHWEYQINKYPLKDSINKLSK